MNDAEFAAAGVAYARALARRAAKALADKEAFEPPGKVIMVSVTSGPANEMGLWALSGMRMTPNPYTPDTPEWVEFNNPTSS